MIMLEDVCTLPSGTQIIIADMLIPGAIFRHSNGHQYVIKDVGKVKTNNVYIEVPSELKHSTSINLVLNIRNKEFVINLY